MLSDKLEGGERYGAALCCVYELKLICLRACQGAYILRDVNFSGWSVCETGGGGSRPTRGSRWEVRRCHSHRVLARVVIVPILLFGAKRIHKLVQGNVVIRFVNIFPKFTVQVAPCKQNLRIFCRPLAAVLSDSGNTGYVFSDAATV